MTRLKAEYSTGEVAAMFGVHRNTILYRIARGELRAFRRGNRWRIGLSALRDVAEQWESVMLRERLSR